MIEHFETEDLVSSMRKSMKKSLTYRIQAHPRQRQPVLDRRVHYYTAVTLTQIRQCHIRRIHIAPKIYILKAHINNRIFLEVTKKILLTYISRSYHYNGKQIRIRGLLEIESMP